MKGFLVDLRGPGPPRIWVLLLAVGYLVHNWTRSALTANREWSLLIDDAGVAAQIQTELSALPGW